jgi:hypothetical protein
MLDDDAPSPLRAPGPKAAALMAEAQALFAQRRLKDALQKYEAAMAADPRARSGRCAHGSRAAPARGSQLGVVSVTRGRQR